MKKLIFIFLFAIVYALAFAQVNYDDYLDVVYLKNGSIVHGIITEQIPGESLKIETADGNVFVFPIDDIEKIAKEKSEEKPKSDLQSAVDADWQKRKYVAVNAGLFMGGGSAVGVDMELMPIPHLGFQAGFGFTGRMSYGLGLNFHFRKRINSSFLSLVYWHQGFDDEHWATWVGPFYTLRLKKYLQAGIGYGIAVSKGPAMYGTEYNDIPGSLMFNIGLYFPL